MTAGVLLAAGSSRRMGKRDKLLLSWGGEPMVRRAARTLVRGGLRPVVVVTGAGDEGVREALAELPVGIVVCPDADRGMAASLAAGVSALGESAERMLLALGDMPELTAATVDTLARVLAEGCRGIVVPVCSHRRGHPVGFDLRKYRAELLGVRGDVGARDVLAAHPEDVAEVPVDDRGVLLDVDTWEEYEDMQPKTVAGSSPLGGVEGLGALRILVRGAGEMASGVAHRLVRSHLRVAMTEVPEPLAVRRAVSFCEAVWDGSCEVEGIRARRVDGPSEFDAVARAGEIPVLVDPNLECLEAWTPHVLVDATVAKRNLGLRRGMAELVVALGPGFEAGVDADVVVESNRGHDLGRLIFRGTAEPDTATPGSTLGFSVERVLRAPAAGTFETEARIGDHVGAGQVLARVAGQPIRSEIAGVLRGLLRPGVTVRPGLKAGDVDPRDRRSDCFTISEKARALGGSVLEAVLMRFLG